MGKLCSIRQVCWFVGPFWWELAAVCRLDPCTFVDDGLTREIPGWTDVSWIYSFFVAEDIVCFSNDVSIPLTILC
jgi:hypothetical protein